MRRPSPFASLNSPQAVNLFVNSLSVIFMLVVGWILVSIILSWLSGPGTILLTIALIIAVFVRSRKQQRRQAWIQQGRCADCGYDLRTTPNRCPECGRDASQDEPTWRRVRRERTAQLNGPSQSVTMIQPRERFIQLSVDSQHQQPPLPLETLPGKNPPAAPSFYISNKKTE